MIPAPSCPLPVWSPSPLESTSYISLGSIATCACLIHASALSSHLLSGLLVISLYPVQPPQSGQVDPDKAQQISPYLLLKNFLKLPKAHRKRPCPGPGILGSLGFATILPLACNTSQLDPSLPVIVCLGCLSSGSAPCQGYLFSPSPGIFKGVLHLG